MKQLHDKNVPGDISHFNFAAKINAAAVEQRQHVVGNGTAHSAFLFFNFFLRR